MAVKIAVVGIGAVGGFLGGLLARYYEKRPGADVYFIARGETLRQVRMRGLIVRTEEAGFACFPKLATDRAEDVGEVDYLLLATKSYDVEQAVRDYAPLIGEKTIIVPFLNGVYAVETLRKMLPETQVWWGCVYIYAKTEGPGRVYEHTLGYRYMYGPGDGRTAAAEPLDRIFADAGINAHSYSDIQLRVWDKFAFVSSIAAISSYTQKNFGDIISDAGDHAVYTALIDEFYTVAEAKGLVFEGDARQATRDRMALFPPDTTSSMQRDFATHHKTELEALVGYIVHEAEALHVEVPHYKKIYTALKRQSA